MSLTVPERDTLIMEMHSQMAVACEQIRAMKEEDFPEVNNHLIVLNHRVSKNVEEIALLKGEKIAQDKTAKYKVANTGKWIGIISAVLYIVVSLGEMSGWWNLTNQ